ncbi:MAG: adenosine deaminase [Pseudomonadota bacterium]
MGFARGMFGLALVLAVTVWVNSPAAASEADGRMAAYLAGMPKAELHLHLEGSIDPATVVELSRRNKLGYFSTVAEIEASLANRPPGLMGFLEHHFKLQEVMQTRQDFYDATFSLLRNLHENNVVYVDLFFDPQAHTSRGIAFAELFDGIDAARQDGEAIFGLTVNLIMCFHRERSVESAMEMLDQAYSLRDRIIGLGMDSGPEDGNPPLKFREVYARAREEGYYLTGHHDVDVQDSLKHIRQSLEILQLDRIDHGLNASDDPALMADLVRRDICLTGSPIKRTTDPAPQDVDRIRTLDAAGVCVSLHTDDPEEFESGYLTNLLILFQEESGYSKAAMTRLMLNAFRALWVSDAEKSAYVDMLRRYAEAHGVAWTEVTGTPF